MRTAVLALVAAPSLAACVVEHAPPPLPPPRAPPVASPAPVAPGHGRVVVDVVDEPAKVARVTGTQELAATLRPTYGRTGLTAPLMRTTELLCFAPCVLDLRQGAHTLVFTSTVDPTRTSTADVLVSSQPVAVRHALGREKPMSARYLGGLVLSTLGGGMLLIGGGATAIGAAAGSSSEPRAQSASDGFLAFGLVVLGVGLVTGTTGLVMALGDRPEVQPGATTQTPLPGDALTDRRR